jgi:hypothetical protein
MGAHDAALTDGPTGFYGIGFEDNLKAYQARNGLAADGLVNPDGETLGRIKQDLTETLGPGALAGGDDGADGSEPDARFIPVQGPSRRPYGAPPEQPARKNERDRAEFQRQSRESERRIPDQVKELDRWHRDLLGLAKDAQSQARRLTPNRSIAAFERYLNGTGGTVSYDPAWIRTQPIIKRAENRVLSHFGNWMQGKRLRPGAFPPDIASKILKLKPGESVSGDTDRSAAARFVNPPWRDKITDFYNLSKDSNVKGIGNFSFTRKGNTIHVTGTIQQNWRDTYDFAPGQTFRFPPRSPVYIEVKSDDLIFLYRMGKARPFQLRSSWQRQVVGQIRIVRNPQTGKEEIGSLTLKWAD